MLPEWVDLAMVLVWLVVLGTEAVRYLRGDAARDVRLEWVATGMFWLAYRLTQVSESISGSVLEAVLTAVSFVLFFGGFVVAYRALRRWASGFDAAAGGPDATDVATRKVSF